MMSDISDAPSSGDSERVGDLVTGLLGGPFGVVGCGVAGREFDARGVAGGCAVCWLTGLDIFEEGEVAPANGSFSKT